MNYQAVRTALEAPIAAAYTALSPAVPVYFDNVINYDSDSADEFVHVNIQFGLTSENALTTTHNNVRGVIVIRVHTQKNQGASRNQTLTAVATNVIHTLNNTPKAPTGTYIRLSSIEGPSFSPDFGGNTPDQQSRRAFTPFFISRLEAAFQATIRA